MRDYLKRLERRFIKKGEEILGVNLSDRQKKIVNALSAGGGICKSKNPINKSSAYYIEHPVSKEVIYIAGVTINAFKKKGVIDSDLIFCQLKLAGI